jgi:putative SOS response-associated peptidase YedK
MCGRYTMFAKPENLERRFRARLSDEARKYASAPHYNIAPTQRIAVLLCDDANGERVIDMARWGLIPSWAKDESIGVKMINARAETLAEKPSFKSALERRRCLVIANGFYEWKSAPTSGTISGATGGIARAKTRTAKSPMYARLRSGEVFAMAGLWETWLNPLNNALVRSCTIITAEPNALIATAHHRMAVILAPGDEDLWLGEETPTADKLRLLKPYPAEEMELYPVSTRVNSPSSDDASLIDPLADDDGDATEAQGVLFS